MMLGCPADRQVAAALIVVVVIVTVLGPLAGTNIQELVVFLETARCLSPSECKVVFYVA